MKELEFLLGRIYNTTDIPVRLYELGGIVPLIEKGITPNNDCLNDKLLYEFNHRAQTDTNPYIREIEGICYFGVASNEKYLAVLGPVMYRSIDAYILILFAKNYQLANESFFPLLVVPKMLTAPLCLLHYALCGEMLSEYDVYLYSSESRIEDNLQSIEYTEKDGIEQKLDAKSFYNQINFLDQIKNGDVKAVNDIQIGAPYSLPDQFVKSWDKNLEYMICSAIALATQAAIEGGVDYAMAYEMNVKYIQRLEKCNGTNDYLLLNYDMKNGFASAVNKAKQKPTMSYSQRIKRYIANNLSNPVKLSDIAENIGRDEAYLERVFKEETGCSIMQELRTQRIDKAAYLLRKTDYSYLDISEMFCFASQSHFCAIFKKQYGCTPKEYRLKFQQ